MLTSDKARRMRARRAGLARARFWRKQGYPNLKRAVEVRKRKAQERRRLGLISPDWARRLRRQGIMVVSCDEPSSAVAVTRDQPRPFLGPRVLVDTSNRGLTLGQISWLNSMRLTTVERARVVAMLRKENLFR
jgi:hypothetical protein